MKWNWQRSDWPNFRWDRARLQKAEELFLLETGVFLGAVKHLEKSDREQLTVESMSVEAVTTSEIEGEILDRASVQSSIRRQFGLATDKRKVGPAEHGVAQMMVDLYRSFANPLSDGMLFRWHRMLLQGHGDIREIGCYRTSVEPMQVISGPIHLPKVHFEAPPSAHVPGEMDRFVKWFNGTAPGGRNQLPALTRAGLAHLYFVSIHPFEDGNGRIGRAIAEKALSQCFGQPTLIALAATILIQRKGYYATLEGGNRDNEVTTWLSWFAAMAIEAQRRTTARVEFLIDKTRLLNALDGRLNDRQKKVLLRMLQEGPDGFKGGLSAANYMTITGASVATTTRDLADMVEKGALTRSGELRYTRYHLAITLRPITLTRQS